MGVVDIPADHPRCQDWGPWYFFDAAVHAFAATLQGVVVAEVGSDLPSSSHTAPVERVTSLSIIHLRFAYGVTGDGDLYPISEALERGKGRTEGLKTLNQALVRGLPSGHRVFGGRAKLIASLPLLAFIKNVYLGNPPLYPAYAVGGSTPCLTCQGTVGASTRGGADASLLAQHLDRQLALADSLQTAARVRLTRGAGKRERKDGRPGNPQPGADEGASLRS